MPDEPETPVDPIVVYGLSSGVISSLVGGGGGGGGGSDNPGIEPEEVGDGTGDGGGGDPGPLDGLSCEDLAFMEYEIETATEEARYLVPAVMFSMGYLTESSRQDLFNEIWSGFEEAQISGTFDWSDPQSLFTNLANNTNGTDYLSTTFRGMSIAFAQQYTLFSLIGKLFNDSLNQARIDRRQAELGCP